MRTAFLFLYIRLVTETKTEFHFSAGREIIFCLFVFFLFNLTASS